MKTFRTTSLLPALLLVAVGCASKPKPMPVSPQIGAAVTSRLSNYSNAWFAGDAAGVSESFTQHNPEERDFAQLLGRLSAAQRALIQEQPKVPESISATVHVSDAVPMVMLHRPWHQYAYAASHAPAPADITILKDVVSVPLSQGSNLTLTMHQVEGHWLIEPYGFAPDRPVGVLTDSLRRQISLTNAATEAIRASNWERLRMVLQQMNQQRMVDKISDSTNYEIP